MPMILKGRNEMHLNQATVIEIFQQWLDRETDIIAIVDSVEKSTHEPHFEITLKEKEQTNA